MKTIVKHMIAGSIREKLMLPWKAKILTAEVFDDVIYLYVLQNDDFKLEERTIQTRKEGVNAEELGNYIATVRIGRLDWHVFDSTYPSIRNA